MNIFIFEGIATSGKSTIINRLFKALGDKFVIIAAESETHEPIMKETDVSHLEFFEQVVNSRISKHPDLLIFDRLYLTQAFRANLALDNYSRIEKLLLSHSSMTIFLSVRPDEIEARIKKASEHRDQAWVEYILTKGTTPEGIARYYITQQADQLELLKTSKVPFKIIDTTDHNYDEIVADIVNLI